MNPTAQKIAALLTITALGTTALPSSFNQAYAASSAVTVSAAVSQLTHSQIEAAIKELNDLGIMNGYADGSMGEQREINRAELATLLYKGFGLENKSGEDVQLSDINADAWYAPYASKLVGLGIMKADNSQFNPQATVTDVELAEAVSSAMRRDIKSVQHWMNAFYAESSPVTRGETAVLLQTARLAIPSEEAQVTSVRSLNAITLIVTFDKPLTATDEVFAKAQTDFALSGGLKLTNMPRLKTGSVATYIVPTFRSDRG